MATATDPQESQELADVLRRAEQEHAGEEAAVAVALAGQLLERARELQTPSEYGQQAELERMISHPEDKATLVEMTDQAFRTLAPERVADQLTHILDLQGIPRFFSPLERTMLRGFQSFGGYLPGVAVPLVKDQMRRETANVILPAEREMLARHLAARREEGVRMNVNLLGEALLGEEEAAERLQSYLAALRLPEVECISVKISTIDSQVSSLGRRRTLEVLRQRLTQLYRAAAEERFIRINLTPVPKFVYLDMEEYRDMHLTAEALTTTLDQAGLESVRAGIALQAYLPDSWEVLRRLADWARKRVERGGAPLTVRLVKGANLEMERVEASLRGWPQAPYRTKLETDANYKRMIREVLRPENAAALRLGVASHNLFDVALALLWAHRGGALHRVQFEMLEGMANHQRRALCELTDDMLLYAAACRREEFLHAIGYLIRRLDENTGPENFLRHAFQLQRGDEVWQRLGDAFTRSLQRIDQVGTAPRRTQDRRQGPTAPPAVDHWSRYAGEPDTDWSLPHNVDWIEGVLETWHARCDEGAVRVPLVIGGQRVEPGAGERERSERESIDPSRPGVVVCRYREATRSQVQQAVGVAADDPARWRSRPAEERNAILRGAAQRMRQRRGDLIAAMVADGGKTVAEADPEVSEAIDFTEFYPLAADDFRRRPGLSARGLGVVAVISPWNFPLAIPCGGVVAALAAGNTVILKPASHTVLPAFLLCQCLWDAGVPAEALQLVPCRGSHGGRALVTDERVDAVVLTGGTETAQTMLADRPDLHLLAETGGKNATIVTSLSDRDQAIKHVLHSAFSHAGQKCSATSLLMLEDEVYHDARFREILADAVRSLPVGSAWDLDTRIGPLIQPPAGALRRGLEQLEPGESWLVRPEPLGDSGHLWRPGIKWDVSPGSFTHRTELFGPVLGVMRFRRLEEAIALVHATGYGLTSGLESLDDREQEIWQRRIAAGNLYINRTTTGAIVLRQPFGGMGKSAFGPGVKAGGPHYVVPLMRWCELPPSITDENAESRRAESAELEPPGEAITDAAHLEQLADALSDPPVEAALEQLLPGGDLGLLRARVLRALDQLADEAPPEFLAEHDPLRLLGQDNFRRYRPVPHLRIRLAAGDFPDDALIALAAAAAVGVRPVVSYDTGTAAALARMVERVTGRWAGRIEWIEESDEQLAEAIRSGQVDRLRTLGRHAIANSILAASREAFVPVIRYPVLADGRIEPLWYLNEQSLSFDYHRYGNLGRRAEEPRRDPT